MNYESIVQTLNTNPVAQQLLNGRNHMRLAYIAKDGTPRSVPMGYLWDGSHFVFCTTPHWGKVKAFESDPRVAFTIDTDDFPPHYIVARGEVVSMETRPGVPDEFLAGSHRFIGDVSPEDFAANARAMYKEMTVVKIKPTFVKVIDFVNVFPGPSRH